VALREDADRLAASDLRHPIGEASGLLLDVQSGNIEPMARWRRENWNACRYPSYRTCVRIRADFWFGGLPLAGRPPCIKRKRFHHRGRPSSDFR